jgi:hypothetical protein
MLWIRFVVIFALVVSLPPGIVGKKSKKTSPSTVCAQCPLDLCELAHVNPTFGAGGSVRAQPKPEVQITSQQYCLACVTALEEFHKCERAAVLANWPRFRCVRSRSLTAPMVSTGESKQLLRKARQQPWIPSMVMRLLWQCVKRSRLRPSTTIGPVTAA